MVCCRAGWRPSPSCKGRAGTRGVAAGEVQEDLLCPPPSLSRCTLVSPAAANPGTNAVPPESFHSPFSVAALEHRANLWSSIRTAPGFPGGFPNWWLTREHGLQGDPSTVPLVCPSHSRLELFFLSFEANFRAFERGLLGKRRASAVERRRKSPALIFKDLRLPGKAPVESLVETCSATFRTYFRRKPLWKPPNTHSGSPTCRSPVRVFPCMSYTDKLWVTDTTPLAPGMLVEQKRLVGSLLEIFSAFGAEWGKRWMRHEGVDAQQWRHLAAAFTAFAPFPELRLEPITAARWRKALLEKSPRCAAGPDNLNREDLLAFPACLTAQLLDLLNEAELSGRWPQQLLDGIISSLEKVPGASKVSQYRPICVLSLVYRTWASIRAKDALCHLSKHAPPGLLGNIPASVLQMPGMHCFSRSRRPITRGPPFSVCPRI